MPICEIDPWRMQYFASARCPPSVFIPTEDSDAWSWNPAHRWVYDKIAVARSQGLAAGPHGTPPPSFPVFSKPNVNLKGMGVGIRVLRSRAEYERHCTPGHMWMTLLEGVHVSSDAAIVDGAVLWWRHATGVAIGGGMFDYWTIRAGTDTALESRLGAWVARHLRGYTGIVNLETIGGAIIEVHLRVTDQWPDLYGEGWVDALVGLYRDGAWNFAEPARRDGYSVALFGRHGMRYRHPPQRVVDDVLRMPSISSLQITFHENRAPRLHAMPPGGFRLAIVNGWDLAAGRWARETLRAHFARSTVAQVEELAASAHAGDARQQHLEVRRVVDEVEPLAVDDQ